MPGEPEEYIEWTIRPDDPPAWRDGTAPTPSELADLAALREYRAGQIRAAGWREGRRDAQRKALALLKSFLTADQRERFRRTGVFLATTAAGHTYRIDPARGMTERVTRHGSRWFAAVRFCLHDDHERPAEAMPPADLALAHLLLLLADEADFLRLANARSTRDQLWNREYFRRMRTRQRPEPG